MSYKKSFKSPQTSHGHSKNMFAEVRRKSYQKSFSLRKKMQKNQKIMIFPVWEIAKPMLVKRKSPTPRGSERFGYMALCAVKATKSQ